MGGMEGSVITVRVRLFAALKDKLGRSEVPITVPEPARASDLVAAVAATHPELAPLLPGVRVAVDLGFVRPDHRIETGHDIALLPPVSGG